jgi:hypothetical protein
LVTAAPWLGWADLFTGVQSQIENFEEHSRPLFLQIEFPLRQCVTP